MTACYAVADWGTTSFRLWLLDRSGSVLASRRSADGLMAIGGRFAETLEAHLSAIGAGETVPVVICGMAGAKNGWQETPYLTAPCALADISRAAVKVKRRNRDIHILPGICQPDPADVMRGEETQIFGYDRDGIFCLPGTHSKWITVEEAHVTRFSTWMTGELFALLSSQSVLSGMATGVAVADDAFLAAFNAILDCPEHFTNALFGLRARPLLDQTGGGASALSGMLIGLELVGAGVSGEVTLIASGPLAELYAAALEEIGATVTRVDAEAVTQAGLFKAACDILKTGERV